MRALDGLGQRPQLGALQGLASLGRRRIFDPGQVLFSQTAGASQAALIASGLVKVAAVSPGRETFLAIRGPQELLGEDTAFRAQQGHLADSRLVVATALTSVSAHVFPADQMRRFLFDNPAAAFVVARSLADRLADSESRLCSAASDSADRRLARLLCDLERYGEPAGDGTDGTTKLPVRLSHAELAAWIGSCRETVDRALRRWRDRGLITTAYRTIVINDRQALSRIAGIRVPPRRPLPEKPGSAARAREPGSAWPYPVT
jgi:CRP/FNR family transcriptional regulator, cyclic AMP receptor protein